MRLGTNSARAPGRRAQVGVHLGLGQIPTRECLLQQVAKAILGGSMNSSSQGPVPRKGLDFGQSCSSLLLKWPRISHWRGQGVGCWELDMFLSHMLSSWPCPPFWAVPQAAPGRVAQPGLQRLHDRGHGGTARGAPKSLTATPRSCSIRPVPLMGNQSQGREEQHNAKACFPPHPRDSSMSGGKSLGSLSFGIGSWFHQQF